ncbi:MAG: NAD(P)/FAD-dependent oxidoreductase [Pseudomonadota bacterium]
MTEQSIEADYLVVGAGAMGLAFTDVLLTDSDATVAIVDRLDKPGGHWNHAYPFVRLHQPSAYYGVNSRQLGENRYDEAGRNKGMMELAGVSEILGYFDNLMRRDFLPTGRVQYFPQCDYEGQADGYGRFSSKASGQRYRVKSKKLVDATYMNVRVPAVTPPNFEVAEGVRLVPPNGLGALPGDVADYCVIGAGKTAMDACLYLMDLGVAPDQITWIKPRDAWLIDRAQMQPEGFAERSVVDYLMDQLAAVAASSSFDDMLERIEACGAAIRIDADREPTMWRCATVSQAEMADLRRIKNVIRKGRVRRLEPGRIMLDEGDVASAAGTLFVNCTADGLERRPKTPIFAGERITLQTVRPCQQLFAAAVIAHVECAYADDAKKNALCPPAQHPDETRDFVDFLQSFLATQLNWMTEPELFKWLVEARLDAFMTPKLEATMRGEGEMPLETLMELGGVAMAKLDAYRADLAAA